MKLIINKDRSVIQVGTWGTVNENDYEILDFEFPAELDGYNKRIVYYLGDERVWDTIVNNKAYITNAITTKGDVKAYVWCTKENTEREADTDFRTMLFEMHFYENENADGIVPTEQQVDGFNTMLTAMNAKIDEVDALEQTIGAAEAERQEAEATRVSNESTRQSNESTRQTNEQTRQSQEAERERRTDEAIGNIEDKTAEYNANAEAKTNEFNQNATQKTNDFNSNYTQKVNDFNSNATSKTNDFNSNASSKTTTFNDNAASKTNTFNSNASSKTTDFNTNAENKTSAFNTNASDKTTAFDNNASSKTSDFNTNAESKTDTFNDNATQKTTDFNTNAQNKIDEYDEHIVEYQAQIDELQEEVEELSENMPWNETEQATEIQVTDAAKYSKNKLELFGNTSQDSTTGKNLFNKNGRVILGARLGGNGTAYSTDASDYYISEWIRIQPNITYTKNSPMADAYHRVCFYTNNNSDSFISYSENNTFTTPATSVYLRFCGLKTEIDTAQIEEGSTATDYEPYTGGQPSPNPDYPQDIHVVTGENTIEVQGKNLFDQNVERKNAFSTGDIGQVVGYGNSSASYSYVNCAKVEANKTYTLTWKIDGTKGATSNRNSKIVDSNNIVLEEFATWINNTTYITFTPKNTGYLVLTTDISSVDIQIEQGSTATLYVPYYHADYPINLGSIELCKIGSKQDYFYKENGNWYKYEAINKSVLNGTEANWSLSDGVIVCQAISNYSISNNVPFVNYFKGTPNKNNGSTLLNNEACFNNNVNYSRFYIKTDKFENIEDFKTWLSTNNLIVYCIVRNVATTQITDETLISQLEAIYNHLALVKGTNHITITPSDLAPYVTLNYMQDLPSKLDNLDSRLSLLE